MKHSYSDQHQLSKHFKYYEMIASDTAERLDLPNVPSEVQVQAAKSLAEEVLEPIRLYFNKPFSPTSWFRGEPLERAICKRSFARWCNKKNRAINESSWAIYLAKKSHPQGQAVDIAVST